jgi:hypothetical protein
MIELLNCRGNQRNTMRTIFVGDLHGCAEEFRELLTKVAFEASVDRLLLTGDAFSRGPAPLEVWRLIEELRPEMVLGNHDDRMMRQLREHSEGKKPKFRHPNQELVFEALHGEAGKLLGWLESLPLYIREEEYLLVHAGVNPERGIDGTSRDEFLTIRTWPPKKGIEGPRWYDHYAHETEDPVLIFGHDAPGGLVVRFDAVGSPYLVGLDSGCVCGGELTAFILEEKRFVQVESRQAG